MSSASSSAGSSPVLSRANNQVHLNPPENEKTEADKKTVEAVSKRLIAISDNDGADKLVEKATFYDPLLYTNLNADIVKIEDEPKEPVNKIVKIGVEEEDDNDSTVSDEEFVFPENDGKENTSVDKSSNDIVIGEEYGREDLAYINRTQTYINNINNKPPKSRFQDWKEKHKTLWVVATTLAVAFLILAAMAGAGVLALHLTIGLPAAGHYITTFFAQVSTVKTALLDIVLPVIGGIAATIAGLMIAYKILEKQRIKNEKERQERLRLQAQDLDVPLVNNNPSQQTTWSIKRLFLNWFRGR